MAGDILEEIKDLRSDMREDFDRIHGRIDDFTKGCAGKHNGVDLQSFRGIDGKELVENNKKISAEISWLKNRYFLLFGGLSLAWGAALILVEMFLK